MAMNWIEQQHQNEHHHERESWDYLIRHKNSMSEGYQVSGAIADAIDYSLEFRFGKHNFS